MSVVASSRLSRSLPTSAPTVTDTMRLRTLAEQKDLLSASKKRTNLNPLLLMPHNQISDTDFFEVNNLGNSISTNNHCWVCFEPAWDNTAFCQYHFDEWKGNWRDLFKLGIDICQWSYAHKDYRGARMTRHLSRQVARDWLAC